MSGVFSYKEIINNINDAIFVHYADGTIIDVNQAMLDMYGFEYHDIVGKEVALVSSIDAGFDANLAAEYIGAALRGEHPLFEWKARRKNGEAFWVEVSLNRMDFDGNPIILAVVRDISRRHPDSVRFIQLAEFKNIISNLSTRFISLPFDRIPHEINLALETLGVYFKVDRAYIFNYSDDAQFMSNSYEWCADGVISYIKSLQNLSVDLYWWLHTFLVNDESLIINDVQQIGDVAKVEREEFIKENIKSVLVVPIFYNNCPMGFIGLDSVKKVRIWQKEEENILRILAGILGNAMVRAKNENALKLASEKAIESDRLKSAFLANMSHEIRTPMNGIVGFAQILHDNSLTKEERHVYSEIIYNSSLQLLNIINDILDLSKIEAGLMNAAYSEFNLNTVLEVLFRFYQPQAKEKNIELSICSRLDEKKAMIYSDEAKITQMLNNLLSNALKFTPKGTINFGVKRNHNFISIYVEDSGIGIDKETQGIIFQRFVRSNDEYAQKASGTGLGLAITKAYVELLGGSIKLESEKNMGACFTLTLPLINRKLQD